MATAGAEAFGRKQAVRRPTTEHATVKRNVEGIYIQEAGAGAGILDERSRPSYFFVRDPKGDKEKPIIVRVTVL